MVARLFSLGVLIALSSLASLGLSSVSTVHAAHPAWSAYAAQSKRPQFRPLHRTSRKTLSSRWRPHAAAVSRGVSSMATVRTGGSSTGYRVRQTQFMLDPYGSRNARPTHGKGTGAQFRPQRRDSTHTQAQVVNHHTQVDGYSASLHSQFRPAPKRRRQSYEELQSESRPARWAPAATYPMVSANRAFGYMGHWPGW